MANGIRKGDPIDSIKDVVQSSVLVPKFDKHLKKVGGHISRNIVEITIKMKTIVQKPLMIKNCVKVSIGERHWWFCSCFSSSVPHSLFILVGWFWRWEVGVHTTVVLWDVASRICSIQLITFLCSSCLAFFSICFVSIHVVHPYSKTDRTAAWKKSSFSLSDRLDLRNKKNSYLL